MTDLTEDSNWCPAAAPVIEHYAVLTTQAEIAWSGLTGIGEWELLVRRIGGEWEKHRVNTAASADVLVVLGGLEVATEYEVRVRALVNGYFPCQLSNIDRFKTAPDFPLFDPQYNVWHNTAGAVSSSVVAFVDGTVVERSTDNGLTFQALTTLDKGQSFVFDSSRGHIVRSDDVKPIYVNGQITSDGRTGAGLWSTAFMAGNKFVFGAIRSNPQTVSVHSFDATTLTLTTPTQRFDRAVLPGSDTVITFSEFGGYFIESDGFISVHHQSRRASDSRSILPASRSILGVPSDRGNINSSADDNNFIVRYSGGSSNNGTVNNGGNVPVAREGLRRFYQPEAVWIVSDEPISFSSYGDGDGSSAAPGLPTLLMKTHYAIHANCDYVAFASLEPGNIQALDQNDNVIRTIELAGVKPYKAYWGAQANIPAGTRFVSSVPCAAWCQPNTNNGASNEDETLLIGYNL